MIPFLVRSFFKVLGQAWHPNVIPVDSFTLQLLARGQPKSCKCKPLQFNDKPTSMAAIALSLRPCSSMHLLALEHRLLQNAARSSKSQSRGIPGWQFSPVKEGMQSVVDVADVVFNAAERKTAKKKFENTLQQPVRCRKSFFHIYDRTHSLTRSNSQ